MRMSTPLICFSLTGNLLLLGLIAAGNRSIAAKNTHQNLSSSIPPMVATRTSLETDDLANERDQLRAGQFPPSLIRVILAAEIRARDVAQRASIRGVIKTTALDPQTRAQLRALGREENQLLINLLGPDPEDELTVGLQRQFPNLTSSKIAALAAVRQKYDYQQQDISIGYGMPGQEQRDQAVALDKAMHEEIASILTPDELEAYDLRTSKTAKQLALKLSAFDPTETEFRDLYKLQSAFDAIYKQGPSQLSDTAIPVRAQAQNTLDDQIASLLGPDRYAEYQRATNYNYQLTAKLVDRLGLPIQTANDLNSLQVEYKTRLAEFIQNVTSSPSGNQEQLATWSQEANNRVSTVLGGNDAAVEAYKQYGGAWLKSLTPSRR